jgi:hypothetical protein
MNKTQKGFALVEGLLISLIIAIIAGTGYYVWHSKNQTDESLANTSDSSQSTVTSKKSSTAGPSVAQKYFTIKEWNVRSPYSGNLTLEYNLNESGSLPSTAVFSSTQLDATSTGCASKTYGGWIDQYLSSDGFKLEDGSSSGKTAAEYAATLDKADYAHVGDYYYFFRHAQAACSDSQASADTETQTNDAVKALLGSLQAIPK